MIEISIYNNKQMPAVSTPGFYFYMVKVLCCRVME